MIELLRYFRHLKACKAALLIQMQIFLAASLGPILYAGLQKSIVDKLFFTLDRSLLFKYSLILLFSAIYSVIFMILKSLVESEIKAALSSAIRGFLLGRMLRFESSFYPTKGTGSLAKSLFEDVSIVSEAIAKLFSALGSLTLFASIGFYLYTVEPWMSGFLAAMFAVGTAWALLWRLPIVRSNHEIGSGYTQCYQSLWSALPNIKSVKLGCEEGNVLRSLKLSQARINRALVMNALGNSFFWQIFYPISWLSFAFVLAKGIRKVEAGEFSTGTFLALVSMVGLIMNPARAILGLFGIFQAGISAALRLRPIRLQTAMSEPGLSLDWERGCGIEFRDVHFSYDGSRSVLVGVSLSIPANAWTSIVGISGSGKSTLLHLIAKLIREYEGAILVGGSDLAEVSAYSVREKIALVTQDNKLMPLTLRENFDVAGDRKDWEIEELAAELRLSEKIFRIEGGLGAEVSESEFSGGEKQRICLARALLGRKEAILLDEVTSALDPGNEEVVMEVLKKRFRGKMIVSVSHHPSMVLASDWIIILKDGKVEMAGTPEALRGSEHFRTLFLSGPASAGAFQSMESNHGV